MGNILIHGTTAYNAIQPGKVIPDDDKPFQQ
jgi:hypothetical protein